jgi:hypothetical protein
MWLPRPRFAGRGWRDNWKELWGSEADVEVIPWDFFPWSQYSDRCMDCLGNIYYSLNLGGAKPVAVHCTALLSAPL